MSENVQNIRQSYNLPHGSHEKLESEIYRGMKNFSRRENLGRHLPETSACAITVCNGNNATKLHT